MYKCAGKQPARSEPPRFSASVPLRSTADENLAMSQTLVWSPKVQSVGFTKGLIKYTNGACSFYAQNEPHHSKSCSQGYALFRAPVMHFLLDKHILKGYFPLL